MEASAKETLNGNRAIVPAQIHKIKIFPQGKKGTVIVIVVVTIQLTIQFIFKCTACSISFIVLFKGNISSLFSDVWMYE
jgi:hypothetical protein